MEKWSYKLYTHLQFGHPIWACNLSSIVITISLNNNESERIKMTLNKQTQGTQLYEIEFTPKGSKEKKLVNVYAKNRLDASNYLILNQIWGKQHNIRCASVNLMK